MINVNRPKYRFKTELKREFFKGKKMQDVADLMKMSKYYLSKLIHNEHLFDEYVAYTLMVKIGYPRSSIKREFNKYFERV